MNVRYGKPFNPEKNKKDWQLVQNVRAGGIEQSFKVRPEKDPETEEEGYGVYLGRRRFLAEKYLGKKIFTVGEELVVRDVTEEEARKASFVEGDESLREEVDPIARAKALQWLVANKPAGLVAVAADLGMGKGRLSEYLRVLDLDPSMQTQVSEGNINYSSAVRLARMSLGTEAQKELAKTLKNEGFGEFEKSLEKFTDKSVRRVGLPPGKFVVVRALYDRFYPQDMEDIKKLEKLAEDKHTTPDKVAKELLHEQLKDVNIHT